MKNIINKGLLSGWCLFMGMNVNLVSRNSKPTIVFCAVENPLFVSVDYEFDVLLNTPVECFLEDDSLVEVLIDWQLESNSVDEFNSQLGSFNVTGYLSSDSVYNMETMDIEIIKEGYSIQAGSVEMSGSDLGELLNSSNNAYVKIKNIPNNTVLSSDMFTSSTIEVLDLNELSFSSLGSDLFSGMSSLKKVVLPPTMNVFEEIVSLNEIEVVVSAVNSLVYKGNAALEKAFFSVLDFDGLTQLEALSLKGYMSNEISSSVKVEEVYSNGVSNLSFSNLDGFEFHPSNQAGTTLNHRVRFNNSSLSHDQEGLVRYYGLNKETYIDKGISFSASFENETEGIKAIYSLHNASELDVSNLYLSIEGLLNIADDTHLDVSKAENEVIVVSNALNVQLMINALTPVNSVWIGNKGQLNDNIYANTYVNTENSAFSMVWNIDTLSSNTTQSFSVIYKLVPLVTNENNGTMNEYTGWIIKDSQDKTIEKMKHFNKEYDHNYNVYYEHKGELVKGWRLIDNQWFFFRENGTCFMKGWIASKKDWFYLDNYSIVTNQWIPTTNGRWYYQDNEGKMVRNQVIESYYINQYGIYWGIASKQDFIENYFPNY